MSRRVLKRSGCCKCSEPDCKQSWFRCWRIEGSGFKLTVPKEEKNHANLVSASTRRIVGRVGRPDSRVAHEWVVGIRLGIGDVPRVLSDGVLGHDTVSATLIIDSIMVEHTVRPFPTPRTFKLMGMPESVPASMAAF